MDSINLKQFAASLSALRIAALGAGAILLACLYVAVYRLFLSPVARVPGPRLAALSFWYEFYYDVVKKGQYTFKIKELHKQYGPIIRINPYEIHIDDPEFYDQVYVGNATRPTDKWWWSANMFSVPDCTFSTIHSALHRRRRMMYSSQFSATAVHQLESLIQAKVDKLKARIDQAEKLNKAINLTYAYSALTMDVITAYSFTDSFNQLDLPEFSKDVHDSFSNTSLASHFSKQFPWAINLFQKLPEWLVVRLVPAFKDLFEMQKMLIDQVALVNDKKGSSSRPSEKTVNSTALSQRRTIFDAMLDADVPPSEKSIARLAEEAQLLLAAGTLTTAHTLMTTTYHLLSNPDILTRLRDELTTAAAKTSGSTSSIPLKTLESLPYLNAVLREGLRMGDGVSHRLQRVSPTTTITYDRFDLPPGTAVSMSAPLMHKNENIFPDPLRFNPDRWLPLDTTGQKLNRYLVPFSKGSRQCLGINLAWAEMYMALAAVFGEGRSPFVMSDVVYERDIETVMDGFNPLPTFDSKGLRVIVGNNISEKDV